MILPPADTQKPTASTAGSNRLILNTATMVMIVQHYLDSVLLKNADTKVQSVTSGDGYTFVVGFIDKTGE